MVMCVVPIWPIPWVSFSVEEYISRGYVRLVEIVSAATTGDYIAQIGDLIMELEFEAVLTATGITGKIRDNVKTMPD